MLVSDGGQLIRVPVNGIRIASRATKGVTIFSTAADEKVVSVERISEPEDDEEIADVAGEVTAAEPGTEPEEAPATSPRRNKPLTILRKPGICPAFFAFWFTWSASTCRTKGQTAEKKKPDGQGRPRS